MDIDLFKATVDLGGKLDIKSRTEPVNKLVQCRIARWPLKKLDCHLRKNANEPWIF